MNTFSSRWLAVTAMLWLGGCCFGGGRNTWPPPSGSWGCDQTAERGICVQHSSEGASPESAQRVCQNGTVDTVGCPTDGLVGSCRRDSRQTTFFYANFTATDGTTLTAVDQQRQCGSNDGFWSDAARAAEIATFTAE